MDVGNGFLKLQEENSRRSSVFRQTKPLDLKGGGLPYATRINCGCGQCLPFRVKVEKDEGGLRIGRLTLAANCHLILLVFGFCFLLAGAILTALAYKPPVVPSLEQYPQYRNSQETESPSPDEEKVAGPLFVIVGSGLVLLGIGLALLGYKLTKEARRQRAALSRFSVESPSNSRSPDFHSEFFSGFANIDDLRSQGGDSTGRSRRGSFFGNSFNNTRRSTLATIAQAVPVGFFMSDSPRTPKTPNSPKPDPNEFQEIELSSPTKETKRHFPSQGSTDDEFNLPALTLRPSLPIPMFGMPNMFSKTVGPLDPRSLVVTSRSDEPFGSIASLAGTGDIACFPIHYIPPVTLTVPESEEEAQVAEAEPKKENYFPDGSVGISELPPIKINEFANALTASEKNGIRSLRSTKSEDRSSDTDELQKSSTEVRRGSGV